jgi:hypothetical protein
MDIQEIRKFHQAEPFRPFYVFLSNGRKLLVRHRENMGYSPSGKAMAIYTSPEASESMSADDIIKLQDAKKRAARKNGK